MNYQIDGGDNNDDTVGGLLQLFPLEAIQEFNFITQRYKAEYGRSNGGVMNIVTKSGTNNFKGSFFTAFRDKSMNAQTEDAGDWPTSTSRTTAATSSAGRSAGRSCRTGRTSSPPSSARSRTPTQTVNTLGLFPDKDGTYPTPVPREPLHGEGVGRTSPRRSS